MARQPLFGRRFDAGRQQLQNNPQYRMALQAQQRGTSTDPVSSPLEGLARALQAPIGALAAGQQEAAMRERQSERNQQVTDMLLGDRGMTRETEAGTGATGQAASPQRQQMEEQLMGALESGLVQPQDLSGVMMQQMGLGPKAEPIEINGRLVDPNTYEVIQDFSDPNTKVVNGRLVDAGTGRVLGNYRDPKTLGKSDLVTVQGPDGPRYVPASQAVGMSPERERREPIKMGDRLLNPDTFEVMADFTQPDVREVGNRLVNATTGETIADYSDPNIKTVNNRVVNVDTGKVLHDFSDPQTMSSSDLVQVQTEQGPQFVPADQASGRQPYQPQSSSDLVEVMTDDGPQFAPASQAAGQRPYEPQDQTQRQRRIGELTQRLGGGEQARQRATDIVDGNTDIEIVPETGRARLINKIDNSVEEVPIGAARGQGQIRADLPSDPLYSTADEAAGVWPGLKSVWAGTAGQIPGVPIDEQTVQSRANLSTSLGELRRAVAINPRFPVAEMERIEEEFSLSPSMWDSPNALRARMQELDRSLQSRMQQAQQDADNPNLPEETRSSQAQNASAIRNFLQRLGVPEDVGRGNQQANQQQSSSGNPPTISSNEEYNALPSGTVFVDPDGTKRRKP